MKKFQLFIIIAIIAMINTNNIYAQSADADYIEMRDKAKVLFHAGNRWFVSRRASLRGGRCSRLRL